MSTTTTRPLIAAMQVTLDGRILGPDGEVDWVDSWADGLALLPPVDAFVLGGGMFGEYERFWAALLADLIDAELLDELRLIVHPVVAGGGPSAFDGIARRHALDLVAAEPTTAG